MARKYKDYTEGQKQSQQTYHKGFVSKCKVINILLKKDSDTDIIEFLEEKKQDGGMTAYIKGLILEDMGKGVEK